MRIADDVLKMNMPALHTLEYRDDRAADKLEELEELKELEELEKA